MFWLMEIFSGERKHLAATIMRMSPVMAGLSSQFRRDYNSRRKHLDGLLLDVPVSRSCKP